MKFLQDLKKFLMDVANDERIPSRDKKVLLAMIALMLSPIDLIPDWIPLFGLLDGGLVGFSILSIFFPSMMGSTASKVYGLVGIVVFAGLTAYDTQTIKSMALQARSAEEHNKGAILGALKLYLDFINLFLFLLRMSGDRRR